MGLGFRVCLGFRVHRTEEWWDCGPGSEARTFSGEIPDPFKRKWSPLRSIPGANNPGWIRPDVMHCFNLGFGKDLAGSSILLLCRLSIFEGSSIGSKLETAFEEFQGWCATNHKTSSLKAFELKTFKIQS